MTRLKAKLERIEQALKPKRRQVVLMCKEWHNTTEEVKNRHLAEHPEDKDADFLFITLRLKGKNPNTEKP